MLQNFRHCARAVNPVIVRRYWVQRSPFNFPTVPSVFNELQRMGREMERMAGIGGGFRPFIDQEHPTSTEIFRLQNPIIEEDGMKKFKLEFDVRRFKPEEVKVNTNAQDSTLSIEAKHSDENSKFEYYRKITIPDGVKLTEITCNYKANGALELQAPYIEPVNHVEVRQDTPISIEHK